MTIGNLIGIAILSGMITVIPLLILMIYDTIKNPHNPDSWL